MGGVTMMPDERPHSSHRPWIRHSSTKMLNLSAKRYIHLPHQTPPIARVNKCPAGLGQANGTPPPLLYGVGDCSARNPNRSTLVAVMFTKWNGLPRPLMASLSLSQLVELSRLAVGKLDAVLIAERQAARLFVSSP